MNLLKLCLLALLATLVACSSKSSDNAADDQSESVVMEDEINEELDELEGIDITDESDAGEIVAEAAAQEAETSNEVVIDDQYASEVPASAASAGALMEYTVQPNDTLMWIAFKIYGDYGMWKKLRASNPGLSSSNLSTGMKLVYEAPSTPFVWSKRGNPYLIGNGDTLGKISDKVYGNMGKWRSIYKNNKQMIKNPNLIFAGFTLYYLPAGEMAASGSN